MAKLQITLSQAIDGYFVAAQARRLSPHTLSDYDNTFRRFEAFLGDDLRLTRITCAGRVFSSVENSSFRINGPFGVIRGQPAEPWPDGIIRPGHTRCPPEPYFDAHAPGFAGLFAGTSGG